MHGVMHTFANNRVI